MKDIICIAREFETLSEKEREQVLKYLSELECTHPEERVFPAITPQLVLQNQ